MSVVIAGLPEDACLGIIAPAGPARLEDVAEVAPFAARFGFRTKIFPSCRGPSHHGYLAAPDDVRAHDLHAAFSDPEVDAVVALRGGYGCARILARVDRALLRRHSKLLVGYSDITALHVLRHALDLPGVHGPMPTSDWIKEPEDAQRLFAALRSGWHAGQCLRPQKSNHPFNQSGVARGRLIGGNLTILASLAGTPFQPDLSGCIVFFEEVAESPYRVDRLLAQLRLTGSLDAAAGFLVGGLTGSLDPGLVMAEYLAATGKPALWGWSSGHIVPHHPLPVGVQVELDAEAETVTLLQPNSNGARVRHAGKRS